MQSVPNLIAIYYKNIGPFQRECSILFEDGKYLIKANIGSGKSFLFFDGPTYALYGSSGDKNSTGSKGRDILNKKSTTGEIDLLFEVDGAYYLIKRQLSRKKIQTSSVSTFFKVEYLGSDILGDIKKKIQKSDFLMRDYNIIEEICSFQDLFRLEQVTFKNETDLQSSLNANLLLDKSVFLNTIFLLQDSKNVFECTPQERILILKNIFGLLGIDAGKEILSDEKKNLEARKKILGDFEEENKKLTTYLGRIHQSYQFLKELPFLEGKFGDTETFFDDIETFGEKISLEDFSLSHLDKNIFLQIKEILGEKNKDFQAVLTEKKLLNEQWESLQMNMKNNQKQQEDQQKLIEDLQKKTVEIDENKIQQIKQEMDLTSSQLLEIDQSVPYAIFEEEIQKKHIPLEVSTVSNFEEAWTFLSKYVENGKYLKQEIEHSQTLIKQNQEKEQLWQDKQKGFLETLETKHQLLKKAVEEAEINYQNFSQNIESEKVFSCDKISGNCPYITLINKKHFEEREKQLQNFANILAEKKKILEDFGFEQKYREEKEKKPDYDFIGEKKNLEEKIKNNENLCNELRAFIQKVHYGDMEQKNKKRIELTSQLQAKTKIFNQLFEEKQKIEKYKNDLLIAKTDLDNLKKQGEEYEKNRETLKEKLQIQQEKISHFEEQTLGKSLLEIDQFLKYYENIEELLQTFFQKKQTIKQVEQRLEKIKNLYNILNSELVVFSFQNFLPVLSDHINGLLGTIANFEISMKPEQKTTNGELELKILFHDDKGDREVSSLSGGQKTLLKLVRMLAISTYLKTPLLFLDETINNLDGEAVSRVATLINDFVKSNTIKFYTITHNSEIQAMNVWDQIIEF